MAVAEVTLRLVLNGAGGICVCCGASNFRVVAVIVLCVVGVATDAIIALAEPNIPAAAHD